MAIGKEECACGHIQSVRGQGVRYGSVRTSESICRACSYVLECIQEKINGSVFNASPFERIQEIEVKEGAEFSYTLSHSELSFTVKCKILTVKKEGGEYEGSKQVMLSIGGKSESDGKTYHYWSQRTTSVVIEVDAGIMSVPAFRMEKKSNGW